MADQAERLVDLLTDEELLNRVSAGAREYGAAHDWDEIVADLEDVYRTVRRPQRV